MYNFQGNELYEKFLDIATIYGTRTAVSDLYNNSITYHDLKYLIDKILEDFQVIRLNSSKHIIIKSDKSIYSIILIVMCWKLNISYTVVPKLWPENRIMDVVAQSKAEYIIEVFEKEDFNFQRFLVDINKYLKISSTSTRSHANLDYKNKNDIAYVMFTSGSTGKPKGVPIKYEQILRLSGWLTTELKILHSDKLTCLNPLYFDNSVFDIYLSLLNGAELILVDTDESSLKWISELESKKPTIWFSVPSLLVNLFNYKVLDGIRFSSVTKFIFGGEAFPKNILKSIFHRYRNSSSFISVYGPTETTCICSYAKVEESDFLNQELFISLGSFAPFFDISLLHLSINNLDIRGELCLSGSNTIDGYLDKSNDKDKLLSIDGRHLYRTGDFVKINLKDNKVYFLGRVDNQIKKMGIRIELEEIEAKIEENLFVQRAMCIYNSENKEIICFVESASKLEVDSLTDFIREKLPKYMIPDKFISVNMIPMNKNGKKDRLKALVDYMSGK